MEFQPFANTLSVKRRLIGACPMLVVVNRFPNMDVIDISAKSIWTGYYSKMTELDVGIKRTAIVR